MRALTLAELAAETDAPLDLVTWLVEHGPIRPLADGRVEARDGATLLPRASSRAESAAGLPTG
jgi:hypothetical protein